MKYENYGKRDFVGDREKQTRIYELETEPIPMPKQIDLQLKLVAGRRSVILFLTNLFVNWKLLITIKSILNFE